MGSGRCLLRKQFLQGAELQPDILLEFLHHFLLLELFLPHSWLLFLHSFSLGLGNCGGR